MNIGNDKNVETYVALVDKNKAKVKDQLEELASVKDKISKQLEPVARELKTKTIILKKHYGIHTKGMKSKRRKRSSQLPNE